MWKKAVSLYAVLLTLLMVVLLLFFSVINSQPLEEVVEVEATTLETAIEKASELTTTKYYYSDIGKYENSLELNGWTIPFTQKDFILTYQGVASIGVNCKEIKVEVADNAIEITVPEMKILTNTIDEASIEVYDEKTNLFNPISISDYTIFAANQKEKTEEKIKEAEIWSEAKKNTETVLREIIQLNPQTEGMSITFKYN